MCDILSREVKENNRIYREIDGLYHELCVRHGLSDSAFLVLYCIVELGKECVQREIADQYVISRQTVNSSVKKLEAEGYVTLESSEGRDKLIVLTEAGQRMVKKKIAPIMEIENAVFMDMLPEERSELLRLNAKYAELFKKRVKGREKG